MMILMIRMGILLLRRVMMTRMRNCTENQPQFVRSQDLSPGATQPTPSGPTTPAPTAAPCSYLEAVELVKTATYSILRQNVTIYVLKINIWVYFDFKVSLLILSQRQSKQSLCQIRKHEKNIQGCNKKLKAMCFGVLVN